MVEDLRHELKFWLDAVAVGPRSDPIQDFSSISGSSVAVDQKDGAAGRAEQFLPLKSQQVWEVLRGVVVHQNQIQPIADPLIDLEKRTQSWDGLRRAGCQHLELNG